MAFTFRDVAYSAALSNAITVNFGTIHNGLVVVAVFYDDPSAAVGVSGGGAVFQQTAVVAQAIMRYTTDPTSTSFSITSTKGSFLGAIVSRFYGDVGPIFNMFLGQNGTTGVGGSPAPGGLSSVSSDVLFLTTYYGYNAPLAYPPGGYTLDATCGIVIGGNSYNAGLAHLIATAPASLSPSWSLVTYANWAANHAMLRPVQSAAATFGSAPVFGAAGTTTPTVNVQYASQSAYSGAGLYVVNQGGAYAGRSQYSAAGTVPRDYTLVIADQPSITARIRDNA